MLQLLLMELSVAFECNALTEERVFYKYLPSA